MSEDVIEAATGNAALWKDVGAALAGNYIGVSGDVAAAWAELSQVMVGRTAPVVGIDASVYATVIENIGSFAVVGAGVEDHRTLVENLINTTVGIAVNALGAIPIVGAVVKALDSLVRMLISAFSNKDVPPPEIWMPFQQYHQASDEFFVKMALGKMSTFDWDSLYKPMFEGEWMAERREAPPLDEYPGFGKEGSQIYNTGWSFRPSQGTGGSGFIPGSQRCTSSINVWFTEKTWRDQRGYGQLWSMPVNYAASADTGDFYPGLSQMLTSVDQQCQKAQTQMWNVNVERVRTWWYEYVRSGIKFAEEIFGGTYREAGLNKLTVEQREVIARAFVGQLLMSQGVKAGPFAGLGWVPGVLSSKTPTIFERIVMPWADRMKKRQLHNIGTMAVATASPKGAAFLNVKGESNSLGDHLVWMQMALLENKQRWNVNLDNVVDGKFRQALLDSRGGSQFTRPDLAIAPSKKPLVHAPPDAAARDPVGGYPGLTGSPARWPPWVLAIAAGAIGYGGYRAYKRYRR